MHACRSSRSHASAGFRDAAIHQRIRKLHDSGVILGSRLIVDPKMLGFDVCALIGICVQDPMYMMQTMEKLKEIPEIVECHFITGNFNILVKLYCLDNEHLMKTIFDGILRIQGISTTQTFISLKRGFPTPGEHRFHPGCGSVEKRTGIGNDGTCLRVRPVFYGSRVLHPCESRKL